MLEIALGQVVLSKAGRDAGRRFIVIGVVDEDHVLVSDGSLRKTEKPKKKKLKHVKATGWVVEPLKQKLLSGQRISNADIREALSAIERQGETQQPV